MFSATQLLTTFGYVSLFRNHVCLCFYKHAKNAVHPFFSSIVNEGIRALLNLFTFFLQEDFTCTKSTKSIKSTKSTERKQATFLLLDVFIYIKSIKSTKNTKRQTSGFPPLRSFYMHKNVVFFVFVHLHAFYIFSACEIFL